MGKTFSRCKKNINHFRSESNNMTPYKFKKKRSHASRENRIGFILALHGESNPLKSYLKSFLFLFLFLENFWKISGNFCFYF